MKRRDMLKLAAVTAALLTTTALLTSGNAYAQDKK
ncbi:MAG: twin-arginine translocation signal domain-containing protein, partial [Mesorhizobium sp.]